MRELPEIECRSRFFPVRVRGSEAIRAVRWPLAFVMCVRVAIIPLALVIAWLMANRFGVRVVDDPGTDTSICDRPRNVGALPARLYRCARYRKLH
jgi:hypothetical protein